MGCTASSNANTPKLTKKQTVGDHVKEVFKYIPLNALPSLALSKEDEIRAFGSEQDDLEPHQSVGMATIQIVGFRGVRTIDGVKVKEASDENRQLVESAVQEHPLLWTGHIGITADKGETIYGFQPNVPADLSVDDMVDMLKRHESFPGKVSDDTNEFRLAEFYHQEYNWNTQVVRQLFFMKPERVREINAELKQLHKMKMGEHGFKYAFPFKTVNEAVEARKEKELAPVHPDDNPYSKFFLDTKTSNCATFPCIFFGIQVDTLSGNLRTYLPALETHSNLSKHGWELVSDFVTGERHHNFKMGKLATKAMDANQAMLNVSGVSKLKIPTLMRTSSERNIVFEDMHTSVYKCVNVTEVPTSPSELQIAM